MLWMSKKCKQIRRTRNFDPQTKAGAWKLSTALLVLDGSSRMDSLDGPIVDLLSHCLSTALMCLAVCCSVATLTGRLACELRLATSRHESHDSHISSGTLEYFLLVAFHTLSLLHFPLPHFQRLRASSVQYIGGVTCSFGEELMDSTRSIASAVNQLQLHCTLGWWCAACRLNITANTTTQRHVSKQSSWHFH